MCESRAKRYERLMKAHDISLQGPPNPRDASGKTGTAKEANAAAKKRKATESDAALTYDEDDEQPTPAAKKKAKKAPKAKDTVVKSEEDESPEACSVPQHDGSFDDALTPSACNQQRILPPATSLFSVDGLGGQESVLIHG